MSRSLVATSRARRIRTIGGRCRTALRINGAGLAVGVLLLGAAGVWPALAAAANNTAPSRAIPVQIGVPFSGSEANGKPDVWRLDSGLRANDRVQFAIDNTRGVNPLKVCVIGNADDFGFDDEVNAACQDTDTNLVTADEGRAKRVTAIFTRTPGVALIWVASYMDTVNNYTITIESVTPAPPPTPPAKPFRQYATNLTARRSGNRIVGRLTSRGTSCVGSERIVLRRVGAGTRNYGSTRTRPNGTYALSLPRRGRYYVEHARVTWDFNTETVRCGYSRSRSIAR